MLIYFYLSCLRFPGLLESVGLSILLVWNVLTVIFADVVSIESTLFSLNRTLSKDI